MLVNQLMRSLYDRRCQEFARDFPVILHLEDTTLVFIDGEWRQELVNPFRERYDLMKEVSHVPLAIYLALMPPKLSLEPIAALLPAFRQKTAQSTLAIDEKAIQASLFDKTEAFLKKPGDVVTYIRSLGDETQFNLARAARLRIEGMHAQVQAWAQQLGAAKWKTVRVVVVTSHMARRESLPKQYFDWLLKDEHRVLLAEGIEGEREALGIFGVHLIDSGVGKAFFDSGSHMHRDLLSPSVPAILDSLAQVQTE